MKSLRRLCLLVAALTFLTLGAASGAGAATFTPNTTVDNTSPGDVHPTDCPPDATPTEDCTLREAVVAANTHDGDDIVELGADDYVLDPAVEHRGLIVDPVDNALTPTGFAGALLIRGAGARSTTIDGDGTTETARVFTFASNSRGQVEDLTVTGGKGNDSSNGGAVKIRDNPDAEVAFTRVWFTENTVDNSGGAISNRGKLIIRDSLFSDNTAGINGGAIENDDELTLINSTFTGNHAEGGIEALQDGTSGLGGAINNTGINAEDETLAFMQASNSTIAGNTAEGAGGGVFTAMRTISAPEGTLADVSILGEPQTFAARAFYQNTIVAKNTASENANCAGNSGSGGPFVSSQGHNLENGTSCQFGSTGDLNAEPNLGGLADNGGQTDTLAELDGSPAIDAGDAGSCQPADQRGITRPQGPICDIGAFERAPVPQQQQQQPVVQTVPQVTPAAGPRCKDHLPPITTLRNAGLTLSPGKVKLKGRSRDRGAPCPVGVKKVEVSLAQVNGTGLNCKFLRSQNAFSLTPFRNCRRRSVRFRAQGTTRWNFTFNVDLPPGNYRAQARGYDKLNHKETPKRRRNIIYFTVK